MKTLTNQKKSVRKALMFAFFLLGNITLSSYKSMACTASFTYTAGVNGHYTFTSTSTGIGAGTFYSWNPGDGSGWQYGSTMFSHIYLTNNTFNARLAIYDSSLSCMDTTPVIPITVTNVTTPCTLSARFTASVGSNGVVTFTSTSTGTNGNTLYFWDQTDSNQRVQGASTYIHTYEYQGTYGVWLIVEDTGSAYCIDSVYETVYVGTADSSHCHLHPNFTYTVGVNGEVSFTSTSTGTEPGDWYAWTPGDTSGHSSYTNGTYSYTYMYNDTYFVKLAIYGDSNCSDSIILPVTVTGACNLAANFSITYDTNSDNGQVVFTNTSAGTNGGTKFYWDPGDGSGMRLWYDTLTYGYPFNGNYNVTLLDSNASGCTSYSTKLVTVTEKDSLQACFTYISDSLHPGQYDFTSCSKGVTPYTYYKWTWGDATPSDSGLGMSTANHTYYINGPYSATLTIWYTVLPIVRRHSASGRYDESSYTLVINVTTVTGIQSLSDNSIYTIYPNPTNGLFHVAVNGLTNDKKAEIRISNMMGQVIYQSNASINGGNILSDINLNAAGGVYLLQVISNSNTYTTRIAIQK